MILGSINLTEELSTNNKLDGTKVNPIGNRLGIIKGWDSNWYGGKDYTVKLVEDAKDKGIFECTSGEGKRF